MDNINVLCTYLKLLRVKHTKSFVSKIYEEEPFRDTLFGIYRILSFYNIKSVSLHLKNKKEINKIKTPFIAYANNDFMIIKEIKKNNVIYYWNNRKLVTSINQFYNLWTGIVLISELTKESGEPNYLSHLKNHLVNKLPIYLLCFLFLSILLMGILSNEIWKHNIVLLSFLNSIIGVFVCYLILLKQLKINNTYADKVCFIFSKHDCNNVLNSPGSKFAGLVSWGEIGFAYFISNLLIFTFIPSLFLYSSVINIMTLPYTIWSIWYQKIVVKQWCPLCLIVLLILWCQFLINLFYGYILIESISYNEVIVTVLMYSIPFLIINVSIPFIKLKKQVSSLRKDIYHFKYDESVFTAMLVKNKQYISDSIIRFGNIEAKNIITVLTNPHCEPCSKTHVQLEELLKVTKNDYCIQYVFTSFGSKYDYSCKFLIAAYMKLKKDEVECLYSEWYKDGKFKSKYYFDKYKFDIDDKVLNEWNLHIDWRKKSQFTGTPTILFNGYVLPKEYSIMDLKYFVDINIKNCTEKAKVQ